MNLHQIVSGAVSAVNPTQLVTVQVSTGSTLGADGTRSPTYSASVQIPAQVQALSYSDMQHADALNIQGIRRSIYLNGEVDGLVRSQNKGGDLITLADGSTWLVQDVPEHWPDWTKCIVTMQDGA